MTLADRIKLIDDMIRENPDYTIKDYLELVKDIRKIEKATSLKEPIAVLKQKESDLGLTRIRKRNPTVIPKYLKTYKAHF